MANNNETSSGSSATCSDENWDAELYNDVKLESLSTLPCYSSATLSRENWDVENDKDMNLENSSTDNICSRSTNISPEPVSGEEIPLLDDEYNITTKFLDKYDFEQIKSFIMKLHENNEELRKPIHMVIELYEKHYNGKINKLMEENNSARNKLIEVRKNLDVYERSKQRVIELDKENYALKVDIKNLQDNIKIMERKFNSQEEDFRNNINDLLGRIEILCKERNQFASNLEKSEAERRLLALELGFTDGKCNAIWKSVSPTEKIKAVPKNELLKHLKMCQSLMLNLENPSFLDVHREETMFNWFELAQSVSEMNSNIHEMKSEIYCLRKVINKEKLTEHVRKELISKIKGHFDEVIKSAALIIHKQSPPSQPQELSSEKELHLLNEIKSLKNEARLRDDLLRTKKSEIDKLNIKVEDLLKQTDNMEVLREQMKTYQEDFFIEREAKDCLAAEKATLSQQLTFMHNRNQQLEYTIDRFQSTDDYENWNSEADATTQSLPVGRHACIMPNCNKSFNSAHELQVHVNECLGQE